MVNGKTFMAVNGQSVTRATGKGDGSWLVDTLLADQKAACLAADPANKDVVYAGTNGNGIFRSTDRGQTWSAVGLSGQIVKALAVSPHDSDVIYAGTKPALIYVSRDGGQSWTEQESFRRIRFRRFWFSAIGSIDCNLGISVDNQLHRCVGSALKVDPVACAFTIGLIRPLGEIDSCIGFSEENARTFVGEGTGDRLARL